jgi:short-subunit dehydrogenase
VIVLLIGAKGRLGRVVYDRLFSKHSLLLINHEDNEFPKADVLINCAGKVIFGSVTKLEKFEVEDLVQSNIVLPWAIAKKFILAGGKHIINIGSTRSLSIAPNKAIYSATKYALKALSESINLDYEGKTKATLICPGNFTNDNKLLEEVVDAIEFAILHPDTKEIIVGGKI